jgi:cobalamin synthase
VLTGRLGLWGVPIAAAIALAALRVDALVVLGAAVAAAVVLAFVFRAWLGGVTGDTLGATSETIELLALVVVAAVA